MTMTVSTFLMLLLGFSTLSSLVTEGIKNIIGSDKNISYNLLALFSSLLCGSIGMAIYYQLQHIQYTTDNIIFLILMGLASCLVSMVGYDKVVQCIKQLTIKG